ncbi:hypothetical protein GCM10007973_08310 [Polymorphobacter multimanifer]|nr:hypothetical protein GCM10007973_08310 [Polymorphobacter multimanifer]
MRYSVAAMFMALSLLLLLQAQAASRGEPASADIVVLGETLKAIRFSGGVDKHGRVRCKVKRSSGDPGLDRLPCRAVYECAERSLKTQVEVQGCMDERLGAYVKMLGAGDPL